MAAVHVPLGWHRIPWLPGDSWTHTIAPRFQDLGVSSLELKRCVYVIRLNGNICIDYGKGTSPTVYVGEGNLRQRLKHHEYWAPKLKELLDCYKFQLCVAVPRVRNNPYAYKDAEAALIQYFGNQYGTTPLWNKQYEKRSAPHYEYAKSSIKEALNKRSGAKYQWAIRPMRSSDFHRVFTQPPKS